MFAYNLKNVYNYFYVPVKLDYYKCQVILQQEGQLYYEADD